MSIILKLVRITLFFVLYLFLCTGLAIIPLSALDPEMEGMFTPFLFLIASIVMPLYFVWLQEKWLFGTSSIELDSTNQMEGSTTGSSQQHQPRLSIMSIIGGLVRILFFLVLYFVLGTIIATITLAELDPESEWVFIPFLFLLVSIVVPIYLVRWQEKRRYKKVAKPLDDIPKQELQSLTSADTKKQKPRSWIVSSMAKLVRILFFYLFYLVICTTLAAGSLFLLAPEWELILAPFFFFFAVVIAPFYLVLNKERLQTETKTLKYAPEQEMAGAEDGSHPSKFDKIGSGEVRKTIGQPLRNPHKLTNSDQSESVYQYGTSSFRRNELVKRRRGRAKSTNKMKPKTGWIPASVSVTIAQRNIGGMVYVGTPPLILKNNLKDKCKAYIDPSLPVAIRGIDKAGEGMPYWPGYSDLSPIRRSTYLGWLAGGRKDNSYNPRYMLLYFFGLERRYFIDRSNQESSEIIDEVKRLLWLFNDNESTRRYLNMFLDFSTVMETNFEEIEPIFFWQDWIFPFSLKYAIGARLKKGDNLTADWLLSWFICHPERKLRSVAKRCREEFVALFKVTFNKRYPDGLQVRHGNHKLHATYYAASGEFEKIITPIVGGEFVPDITDLREPIRVAQEIANDVMYELEPFSRYLARNPDGRRSVQAQILLPRVLRAEYPGEELNQVKDWASELSRKGGLVPVLDVISRIEGKTPENLSKSQLTRVADILAQIGFGFAPDPRFALRSPKMNEPVVLFELGEDILELEDVSADYRTKLLEVTLGTYVAHADGKITEKERGALLNKVANTENLSEQEKRRLHANLIWMLEVPPDLALLRKKLKNTNSINQEEIRSALILAAHSDGMVQSSEVAEIERVYKALGFDPKLVYSDLHEGELSDGLVRVREAKSSSGGENIPPVMPSSGLQLDSKKIATIQWDTRKASSVLGEIFDDLPDEPTENDYQTTELSGLDTKHTLLVKDLITRENWTEKEFQNLCKRHGLMHSGALENINEWAFDSFEEVLLDEYDDYDVSQNITEILVQKLN